MINSRFSKKYFKRSVQNLRGKVKHNPTVMKMTEDLYKLFLYRENFCAYRKESNKGKAYCKHPFGFDKCDLSIGPIVQEHFANVIFKPDGIKLVIKKPSESKIGGTWTEEELEIKADEQSNKEEIIDKIKGKTEKITERNKQMILQRVNDIYKRYEFLAEKGKLPTYLGGVPEEKPKPEKEVTEEELLEEEEELFKEEGEELFKEEPSDKEDTKDNENGGKSK